MCHVNRRVQYTDYQESYCDSCIGSGAEYDWNKFFELTDMTEISQETLSRALNVPILPVTLSRQGNKPIQVDMVWKRIIRPELFVQKIWTYENLSYLQLVTDIEPDNYSYTVGGIIIDLEIP